MSLNTEKTACSTLEPPTTGAEQRSLPLQRICLDFECRAEQYLESCARFLKAHADRLGVGLADPFEAYLQKVWPDNLPGALIIANISADKYGRWLIRPPVTGPLVSSFAAGQLAPAFTAYRKQARLLVDGFQVVPHVPPRPFEIQISGQMHINPTDVWMEADDFARLEALPRCWQNTRERLDPWRECLDWKEKLAHLSQVALRYERCEVTADGEVRFSIRGQHSLTGLRRQLGSAVMLVAPLGASQLQERWDPHPDRRQRFVNVGPVVKVAPRNDAATSRFNQHEERRRSRSGSTDGGISILVTVQPDDDDNDAMLRALPEEGFLLSSIFGDIKPLNSERRGIDRFQKGQGHNPYLPGWIFDIREAGLPEETPSTSLDEDALAHLDDDQRAAVVEAMAAPDLFLLEGPPGTGKTTTIAALCKLIASAGGRVLVASQTNLAVDNALCRLPSQPELRPIRVGQAQRIEEECRAFLDEHAPKQWLQRVRQACQERLQQWQRRDQRVRVAAERFSTLRQLLSHANELRTQIAAHETRIAERRAERTCHAEAQQSARERAEYLNRRRRALDDLAAWAEAPNVEAPAAELLADTPAAGQLNKVSSQLRAAVRRARWKLPWLSRSTPHSLQDGIVAVQRARQILDDTSTLESSVRDAISLCSGDGNVSAPDTTQRLKALQAEKKQLLDSENEDDLVRVAAINREIKRLRDDRWAALCRAIEGRLHTAFDGQPPAELDDLVSSLQPAPSWVKVLERLLDFTTRMRQGFGDVLSGSTDHLKEAATGGAAQLAKEAQVHWTGAAAANDKLCYLDSQTEEDQERLEDTQREVRECEHRWTELWPDVCPDVDEPADPPVMSADALRTREEAFNTWNKREARQWDRQRRWLPILEEWIHRVGEQAAAERQDLKWLYVKHANVVGLTCTEAGRRDFYDCPEFKPFDVAIIDEVSKATPVELLLAMLLARKVILVGDHRQLPPMFRERESSYTEAVEEGLIATEDFLHFKHLVTSSFFQELFEAAPNPLRHSLTRQYRMHPQIMHVDNQFYDGRLVAGGGEEELGKRREHHLSIKDVRGGRFLEPHQHVLWIDSTKNQRGRFVREEQRGSSKANPLEVELITAALVRLNQALAHRGYGPCRKAVATQSEDGIPLRDWVKRLVANAVPETIDDFFLSDKVKLNGRAARPDELIRTGDKLELDARKPVGVITFYGAQLGDIRRRITRIRNATPGALAAVELRPDTVDRFQGMERPIVLVSLVRARPYLRGGEFVKDYHRINVAMSRAQELLIIIGSEKTFSNAVVDLPPVEGGPPRQVPVYRNIYEVVKRYGGRRYANQLLR